MVNMEKGWQEIWDKTRLALLYDLYGALLTEKANASMSLYLNEDWTISEIAESLSISRQAVHDSLQRSQEHLEHYEASLGVLARFEQQKTLLDALDDALAENDIRKAAAISAALRDNL